MYGYQVFDNRDGRFRVFLMYGGDNGHESGAPDRQSKSNF
jgi:hypothetical protein